MIKLNTKNGDLLAFGVSILLVSASLILFFLPAPQFSAVPAPDPSRIDKTVAAESVDVGINNAAIIQSLAKKLDLSDLPAPITPEPPPPDPAAELKRYRFLGSAVSGENVRALFESNGAIYSIKIGGLLAGFTLARINQHGAVFDRDGLVVELPLEVSQ